MRGEHLERRARDFLSLLGAPAEAGEKTAAEHLLLHLGRQLSGGLDKLQRGLEQPPAPEADAGPSFSGTGLLRTLQVVLSQAVNDPQALAEHYAGFAVEALSILEGEGGEAAKPGDFRFKDRLWSENPLYRTVLQLYLAWGRSMQGWVDGLELSELDRRRIDFIVEQLVAAASPANLPLNPSALRRAARTKGESVVSGLRHWMDDAVNNRGMPRQILPGAYTVGKDLAVSPGAVVFRNEQLELIQYAPTTPVVRRRPLLLLPAQINKYYCFDLRPQNSMLGHLVKSGIQTFAISWRNPTRAQAHWGLDTYVTAVLEAVEATCAITRSPSTGLISACAGGMTAMAVLGYLAETGSRRVSSHSLLVTCLFPGDGSELELFATPENVEFVRQEVRRDGLMQGDELAKVFFWFRPDDLVWRYWINNYLLGKDPPRMDVLYWDNDSTRLPAALHSDLIDIVVGDVFRHPNRLTVLGRPIDFGKLDVASYFVGGEDDYLMPWRGCFRAYQAFGGRHQFVLSTSGHVQSLLRPPQIAGKHYYVNARRRRTPEEWRRTAERREGSWWPHWHAWLAARSGPLAAAPEGAGNGDYPRLADAPGSYVFQ